MTTTFISADIIGTTVAHTWAAGDDHQLYIASGVNVVNTSSLAIADMNGNDLTVSIAGTVFAGYRTVLDGINNTFHVAEGGSYISADSSTGSFAFGDANSSGNNTYIIDGSVTALQTSGVVGRGNASINVTGEIAAGGNAVFMGLFGADGDSLINSGTIRGGMRDFDAAESSSPERFAHGVFIEGDDTRVINLAGGMITTMAENIAANEGPAGIEYQDDISGARLRNYGEVSSVYGYGVDMSTATNLTDTSFINFGVVQGSLGSLRGDNSQATTFVNRGLMDGDVIFGTGDDDFDNRAGDVDGDVLLGAGDDFYDGRLDAYVTGAILGGDGADVVYGGHNADLIEGGENNDELRGNGGDDEIRGDNGDDMMLGNDGDDEIIGGNGNDSLFGGRGNDVLNGGNDNDRINGGDGDDRIIAGGGTDILFGDGGADTFTFASVNDSGMTGATRDRIFDFDQAEGDVVFLASIDANDNVGGNQVFSYIAGASFSNTAGELRYTSSGMIEGDTDGDGSADFQILLTTAPTLTVDAFVL